MKNEKLQIKIQKFKNVLHLLEAIIANLYYGFPSKKLKIIGVTGTDGKTTTAHLIYHILKSAGKKVSILSTIYAKVGNREFETGLHTTTPASFLVQKLLRIAVDYGDEYFVLETTAHGIDQNRIFGINYFVSVLTNITHEHMTSVGNYDYFQTYDNYLRIKVKLLLSSNHTIINQDDRSFLKVGDILKRNNKVFQTYSLKSPADYNWLKSFKTHLPGEFNKYNILGAFGVARTLGITVDQVCNALESFKLPKGRLNTVYDRDFKIIIDFAHTINAINQVLKTIKNEMINKNRGRIIHVFGSAGLRDFSKRPLMGEVSAKYADVIILTEEDFRTEDVNEIINQIEKGIPKKFKIFRITNRQEAINKAVTMAKKDDVVIITGKGHEKSLCRGKIEYQWDEYEAVRKSLSLKVRNLKS